jgi:hypothetical protein
LEAPNNADFPHFGHDNTTGVGSLWYNGTNDTPCTVDEPKAQCNTAYKNIFSQAGLDNDVLDTGCIGNSLQCNGFTPTEFALFLDFCLDPKYTTLEYCSIYDFRYYNTVIDSTHAGNEPNLLSVGGIGQPYLDELNAAF